MPKRKNTTTKNANRKAHKHAIRKPNRNAPLKFRGGDEKLKKNDYFSLKYMGLGRKKYNEINGIKE